MRFDVLVVGGSFAGLSAALQLARARRHVLVVDAGEPRNRYATHSHGFLGHDGKPPARILAESLEQLMRYPTTHLRQARALNAERDGDGFVVDLDDGTAVAAARLVLACGVRDELPALDGLRERWGCSVAHCPYCHGYEAQTPLGVLALNPLSLHQALMLPDWGETTLFTHGRFEPNEDECRQLANRRVHIERTPIAALLGEAPRLDGLRLADGRRVPLGTLFVAPRSEVSSPLAAQLGCAFEDGPAGAIIRVDALGATSVPGVFAAGDAAMPFANVVRAAAGGAMAGVAVHRSLVMDAAA